MQSPRVRRGTGDGGGRAKWPTFDGGEGSRSEFVATAGAGLGVASAIAKNRGRFAPARFYVAPPYLWQQRSKLFRKFAARAGVCQIARECAVERVHSTMSDCSDFQFIRPCEDIAIFDPGDGLRYWASCVVNKIGHG